VTGLRQKITPQIGGRCSLSVEAGLYKGKYPTRMEDCKDDLWAFAHPMRKGGLLPLYREMAVTLLCEEQNCHLWAQATVVRSDMTSSVPLLWVRPEGDVERIQRRRFVRVTCLLEAQAFCLDREDRSPLQGGWFVGKVFDISLGGMRLRFPRKAVFGREDELLVRLELDEPYWTVTKVMRRSDGNEGTSEAGLEFQALPRVVEKALLDFIRRQELLKR